MSVKMHLKCVDDQNEWEFELTPEKEWAVQQHLIFLQRPEDTKGLEMPEMKCSVCSKNHNHEVTRTFVE